MLESEKYMIPCKNVIIVWLQGLSKLTKNFMVVSISSSQGIPVDARQVVFGHLHNKSLTLSHCGRKFGYRNVVCEKNVVL